MRNRRGRPSASVTLSLLLLGAAAAFSGCEGDDAKRTVEAQAGEAGAPGSEPGGAGEANAGGSTGAGANGGEGAGGAAEIAGGAGGVGGAGLGPGAETLAPFGMLFSVAPGAEGVPASGVAEAAPDAASHLYVSTGSGATHVEGTNTLGHPAAALGLDDADDVDAISVIHPAAPSAFYFSVVDVAAHDEGVDGSGVRRSSGSGEVQSDIFVSYALAPSNGNGSNIEWVDEYRLGLGPEGEGEPAVDDLNALDVNVPPGKTPLFFSVAPGSTGALGSAVAAVAPDERGCTIFSTDLDGTNQVAFTCAQLGLAATDDVDALVVLGVGEQPRSVLFSVTPASTGLANSAVAAQAGQAAADVFASNGSGDNVLYIEERALGLLPDDDLDALAIESAYDPGSTSFPPPPENPPSAEPPRCPPWELATVVPNPGADLPVPHSLPASGSRVAIPGGKIVRTSRLVRRFTQADADRFNRLKPCGARRAVAAPPGSPASRFEVICPIGASQVTPGNYFIGVAETEQALDFDAWQQLQVALVVDTDGSPANNYVALPPYTLDTFDDTDRVIQIQKAASNLVARAQDISDNTFEDVTGVADRVIVMGRHYFFLMQVEEAVAYPHRFTFYAANGQDWSMSNVALVGEPMEVADVSSCL